MHAGMMGGEMLGRLLSAPEYHQQDSLFKRPLLSPLPPPTGQELHEPYSGEKSKDEGRHFMLEAGQRFSTCGSRSLGQ